MLLTLANVTYVLVAVAMTVLILMQRGSGADAGAGFGGGASATVFGARGSSSFLSTATKWLAIVFFAISMGMAWHVSRNEGLTNAPAQQDLGVMADIPTVPAVPPSAPSTGTVPAAPAQTEATTVPAPAVDGTMPAAPRAGVPASAPPAATKQDNTKSGDQAPEKSNNGG